jgi:fructokinase
MNATRPYLFGEVLFDCFPDGSRVIGGAPFNVAWHLQAFGQRPLLVSRVGLDAEGMEVRAAMRGWRMDTSALQADPRLPTGRVNVEFEAGEPAYDIRYPAAFDAISGTSVRERPRLLYHGSLGLRSAASRIALEGLITERPAEVFLDVNLRDPWWSASRLLPRLATATWVKLNAEELARLAGGSDLGAARAFLARYGLQGVVVTHGAEGAEVLTARGDQAGVRPDARADVVDTVGAGDALTAVMICGLLQGWPLPDTLDRAQAFASAICGCRGATVPDADFYRRFVQDWGL